MRCEQSLCALLPCSVGLIGPVGAGKSALCGALLEPGMPRRRVLKAMAKARRGRGAYGSYRRLLMDVDQDELFTGTTIRPKTGRLPPCSSSSSTSTTTSSSSSNSSSSSPSPSNPSQPLSLSDLPGGPDRLVGTVSGIARCDFLVLVVDGSMDPADSQVAESVAVATSLGIPVVAVCLAQMDKVAAGEAECSWLRMCSSGLESLEPYLGHSPAPRPVVPTSLGDANLWNGLAEHGHPWSWYEGPALLPALRSSILLWRWSRRWTPRNHHRCAGHMRRVAMSMLLCRRRQGSPVASLPLPLLRHILALASLLPAGPLRLVVAEQFTVRGGGLAVVGLVYQGSCSLGDQVCLLPGRLRATVRDLQSFGRSVSRVHEGQVVGLLLSNRSEAHVEPEPCEGSGADGVDREGAGAGGARGLGKRELIGQVVAGPRLTPSVGRHLQALFSVNQDAVAVREGLVATMYWCQRRVAARVLSAEPAEGSDPMLEDGVRGSGGQLLLELELHQARVLDLSLPRLCRFFLYNGFVGSGELPMLGYGRVLRVLPDPGPLPQPRWLLIR